MQGRTKGAVISGVCAVVVGAAGYGGYTLLQGTAATTSAAHAATAEPSPTNTTPASPTEVANTADDFLAAWASGDAAKAAGYTDDSSQASPQLAAFRTQLHATSVALASKAATGASVPFSVNVRFDYSGRQSSWTYDSSLTVIRDATGRPAVKWVPSVLYPKLTRGESLETDASVPPPVTVVDRTGKALTATQFPSLAGILGQLQSRYADKLSGTPGVGIRAKGPNGATGQVLHQLSQGKAGKPLPTTIDSNLQAQAQKAATTKGPDASVVVIQPSTGGILAVANNPAVGYNKAMMGTYASGSTFKVITASTLLSTGTYTTSTPLACPKTISYGGLSFHNVEMMQLSGATVASDFAASCNTAFISTANVMPDGAVESEARDVFGLGLNWSVGVASFDGSVPTGTGAAKAMTYIGQGQVQLNPLDMASVAATAKAGVFHQPYIVPPSVDGRQVTQAPRRLSSQVDSEIQSLMRLTAREGTAAPTIGSLSGDVGAKTGTAEVDGVSKPNSWFLAYRGDVAAAALVPNSGEGYKFAGPIVTAILRAAG